MTNRKIESEAILVNFAIAISSNSPFSISQRHPTKIFLKCPLWRFLDPKESKLELQVVKH